MTKSEAKPAIAAVNELFSKSPDGLREIVRAVMQEMLEDDGRVGRPRGPGRGRLPETLDHLPRISIISISRAPTCSNASTRGSGDEPMSCASSPMPSPVSASSEP